MYTSPTDWTLIVIMVVAGYFILEFRRWDLM